MSRPIDTQIGRLPIADHHPGATLQGRILGLLGRLTTSGRYIPEVDGLRLVAILAVLLAHIAYDVRGQFGMEGFGPAGRLIHSAFDSGYMGVPLFFAISGFILALPFAESALGGGRTVRLRGYYRRRVMRIEPPYVINITILFGLQLLARTASRIHLSNHYLASLFYVHNLVYQRTSEINFVAWSLEVEVQFYLIAPLLARVYWVRSRATRRLLLVMMMAVPALANHYFGPGLPDGWQRSLPFWLQYFAAGFLVADVYLVDWAEKPARSFAWDVAATAGLVALFAAAAYEPLRPWTSLCLLVAFAGTFRGRAWGYVLSNRWIATLGGMCYTIYLYHYWLSRPVHKVLDRLTPGLGPLARLVEHAVIGIPIVLAGCAVFFVLFEKPFMRRDWPSRLAGIFGLGASGPPPRSGDPADDGAPLDSAPPMP